MKIKISKTLSSAICALVLLGAMPKIQATTYTATTTGNWSATATWGGSGPPSASDSAIIPSSVIVTVDNSAGTSLCTASGQSISISGQLTVSKASVTFGSVTINSGGIWSCSGIAATMSGNLTVNGTFTQPGGNNTTLTFSGVQPDITTYTISGSTSPITIGVATFTGNYTIPANTTVTFPGNSGTGLKFSGSATLDNLGTVNASYGSATSIGGIGTLINDVNATLNIASGATFTFITGGGTLTTSAAGNTVNWTSNGKTAAPLTYVNLGLTGGGTMSASGSTVTGTLTVSGSTTIATGAWPTSPVGAVVYSSSGSSTFPATLSISSLNQSAGTLNLSSAATLTVTGTGAGIWTRSAGTFTANATSTVKFTGAAPDIGGAAATAFGKLLIDSTATTATASGTAFTVATALTINPNAQLDISALSGSSLTLGASASLTNSGTIKGSIVTGATGKVFAGTDGGYGTSTIALTPTTGDLNLTSGSTVNLDVNTTAAAANDLLAVGGTLTLNSTVFNLKAPSNGATIDTANDYTLATAGTISGTPVLHWVTGFVPANSTDYVLVVSGGTIKLHDAAVVPVGSPTITMTSSGGTLTLSWDSTTFPGYSVQAQTNSINAGLGNGWSDTGSGTVSPYTPTIDQANPTVFYRLAHP